MEWVETTGKTVEEAKEAALDQLGVDHDDAEFEVLSEPKPGLFGRMRSEARVRARVRPTHPRPKEERRPRRRAAAGGASATATGERRASAQRTPRAGDTAGAPADSQTKGTDMDQDVPLGEQAEVGREFLGGLLERFGVEASVTLVPTEEDTIELRIEGGDLGVLIGPKGQTLASIQELTRTAVQRKTGSRHGWLVVDVGGYRQKRRQALERFALDVADEVKGSGLRRALEPMAAGDRKVVHDAINAIEGVTTTSEGEEPRRRVVLLPES